MDSGGLVVICALFWWFLHKPFDGAYVSCFFFSGIFVLTQTRS